MCLFFAFFFSATFFFSLSFDSLSLSVSMIFFFSFDWSINSLRLCVYVLFYFACHLKQFFFLLSIVALVLLSTSMRSSRLYSVILINVWIWINHERVKIAHLNFIRHFVGVARSPSAIAIQLKNLTFCVIFNGHSGAQHPHMDWIKFPKEFSFNFLAACACNL